MDLLGLRIEAALHRRHAPPLNGVPVAQALGPAGVNLVPLTLEPRSCYLAAAALTRGKAMSRETLADFVAGLELPEEAKARLLALTPADYTGLAEALTRRLPRID